MPKHPFFQYDPALPARPVFKYVPQQHLQFRYQTNSTKVQYTDIAYPTNILHKVLLLINQDREKFGLLPVLLDDIASQVAHSHVQDMALSGYFSHWDQHGYGPDIRYGLAEGTDMVMENLSYCSYQYTNGKPAPITDWDHVVVDMHAGLMNSPGHRANILDPCHTHVGLGLAYNTQTGEAYLAQEFLNHYVTFDNLVFKADLKQSVKVQGIILGTVKDIQINLAYEPVPKQLSVYELNHALPKSYKSPAEIFKSIRPNLYDRTFEAATLMNNNNRPGFYHLRVWAEVNDQNAHIANILFKVQP